MRSKNMLDFNEINLKNNLKDYYQGWRFRIGPSSSLIRASFISNRANRDFFEVNEVLYPILSFKPKRAANPNYYLIINQNLNLQNLTNSAKQFEQNYLYMKFAQVLLKFHDILNKLVSAKILEDDNFPDAGEMFFAWILRSDVIVPYIERINGNSGLKIFEDNQRQDIQHLLSQTLHVFWELNKRYKIQDKVNNMLGTFTHNVVLLKTMELPHVS